MNWSAVKSCVKYAAVVHRAYLFTYFVEVATASDLKLCESIWLSSIEEKREKKETVSALIVLYSVSIVIRRGSYAN